MFNRTTPYILFFFVILLQACQSENPKKDTWFVGKIDNPRWDYVIIKHKRFVLDTVPLDENNFFHYKFSSPVKEGMYTFIHDDTHPFYIAQGDSLLLLANTLDFEASIYYTNDHAEENNLLMGLNHRLKNDNFYWAELSEFTPEEFEEKLIEREKENQKLLDNFREQHPNATKLFLRIARGIIEQDTYLNKERYIYAHRVNELNSDPIPDEFFAYRKKINFKKDTMEVYYPYYRFLHTYLDNKVLDSFNNRVTYDRSDYELNKYRLNLINEIVEDKSIKNHLLYTSTRTFLLYTKDSTAEKEFLKLHNKLSTCNIGQEYLEDLSSYTLQIKPGNKIPKTKLLNYDNTEVNLQDIINKPSVLFFWSNKDIQHQKTIHTRIKELHFKYPEYQFIGINTDNHFKKWRNEIDKLGYDYESEFQFYDSDLSIKELVLTTRNKVLILDKDGIIRNGHANIYQRTIENELLQYLN